MSLKNKKLTDYSDLADARIITKNLVYVIGLSASIANRDLLMKKEYFGQYGSIVKMVVNRNKAYNQNSPKGPSYSAYITYSKPYEASIAILSLDNVTVDDHLIRASFGTTKYCTFFLRHIECTNKECLFLHKWADESDIICREDLNSNKNIFLEQQIYALKIADIYNPEIKKRLTLKKSKNGLPSPDTIYNKEVVKEHDPSFNQKQKMYSKNYEEDFNKSHVNPTHTNTTNNSCKNLKIQQNTEIKEITEIIEIRERNLLTPNLNCETTSTSSKDDYLCEDRNNSSASPILNPPEIKNEFRNIFTTKNESRFCFNKLNNEDLIEIPQFVQQLINKKMSRHKLTRYIHNWEDASYFDKTLENEFSNNNHWAKFILENKQMVAINDDEFVQDFDYINNLVFSKCSSQTHHKQKGKV